MRKEVVTCDVCNQEVLESRADFSIFCTFRKGAAPSSFVSDICYTCLKKMFYALGRDFFVDPQGKISWAELSANQKAHADYGPFLDKGPKPPLL